MNTPRITVQISPLIWFVVAGEPRADGSANRHDAGLIGRLHNFLYESHITHARAGGIDSPGRFSYGFHPDDAPTITAWLRANGAIEEKQTLVFSRAQLAAGET